MKNTDLNIIIHRDNESGWLIGQIEEFPAAISQGKNLKELKENLSDALKLLLEVQKESLSKEYYGTDITRETLHFTCFHNPATV